MKIVEVEINISFEKKITQEVIEKRTIKLNIS